MLILYLLPFGALESESLLYHIRLNLTLLLLPMPGSKHLLHFLNAQVFMR
jgi:hypothetical protein